MADKKRKDLEMEKEIEIEKAIAAEFSENDDIVDYVEGKTLDDLRKRYSVAEEDEEARNEGFDPVRRSGLFKKVRPGGYGYYYSPQAVNNPDEIKQTDVSPLSKLFDSAKSEFDADSISFNDLDLEQSADNDVVPVSQKPEGEISPDSPPAPKKRGRPPKNVETNASVQADTAQTAPVPKKRGRPKKVVEVTEAVQPEEAPVPDEPIISISNSYNTNTKVIFTDDAVDDGIRRNTDNEIESMFFDEPQKNKKSGGIFKLFRRK